MINPDQPFFVPRLSKGEDTTELTSCGGGVSAGSQEGEETGAVRDGVMLSNVAMMMRRMPQSLRRKVSL